MKLKTVAGMGILIFLTACGGGGGGKSGGSRATESDTVSLTFSVETPEAIAALTSDDSLYYAAITTSNGETTLVEAAVPAKIAAAKGSGSYRLSFPRAAVADRAEVALAFYYVWEEGEDVADPVVLARVTREVSWADPGEINFAASDFTTGYDSDADGLANVNEIDGDTDPRNPDTDGDGLNDSLDLFPSLSSESADFDGDGEGDNADLDDDNDGLRDSKEAEIGSNAKDSDSDDDGLLDGKDNCPVAANADQKDSDGDTSGDVCDSDDDGDGISDGDEVALGTSPTLKDTDGDGVADGSDRFPTDSAESADADSDGTGDNADLDDDNDGAVDSAEAALGSDPHNPDTDGDSHLDGADNCAAAANADQLDTDVDTAGDICDSDDDADGLADTEEVAYGTDGWQTNSVVADTDGDSVADAIDNCPTTANPDQANADSDFDGDICDCVSTVSAAIPNPEAYSRRATDRPDLRFEDTNCDGLDGTHTGDANAIGVYLAASGANGDGTRLSPFTSLTQAAQVAMAGGRDLYVATGRYNAAALAITAPIRLYGGFSADFENRTLDLESDGTVFFASGEAAIVSVFDVEDGVLQGMTFEQQGAGADDDVAHIELDRADGWTLAGNRYTFDPGAVAENATAVAIYESDEIAIGASRFYPAPDAISYTGLFAEGSAVVLQNAVIETGASEGTVAVHAGEGSAVSIALSTLDGGSHSAGTSRGVVVDSATVTIAGSIILMTPATSSYAIACTGIGDLTLENAIFYTGTSGSVPLYQTCSGGVVGDVSALDSLAEVTASGNREVTGTRSTLIDATYHLVSGSPAIDTSGLSSTDATETNSGIAIDWDLEDRSDGALDTGADEF